MRRAARVRPARMMDRQGTAIVREMQRRGSAALLIAAGLLIAGAGAQAHVPALARPFRRDPDAEQRAERFYASLVTIAGEDIEVRHPPGEVWSKAARALLERREAAARRMAARLSALLRDHSAMHRSNGGHSQGEHPEEGGSRVNEGRESPGDRMKGADVVPPPPVRFVLFPSLEAKMTIARSTEEAGPSSIR